MLQNLKLKLNVGTCIFLTIFCLTISKEIVEESKNGFLDKLYKTRQQTIQQWDKEEYMHTKEIKRLIDQYPEYTENREKSKKKPTLSSLIAKGIEKTTQQVSSKNKFKPQKKIKENQVKEISEKDKIKLQKVAHIIENKNSALKKTRDNGYEDEKKSGTKTTLFLLAMIPVVLGGLILLLFIVLFLMEVIYRTRPKTTRHVYNDSITMYNQPIYWKSPK